MVGRESELCTVRWQAFTRAMRAREACDAWARSMRCVHEKHTMRAREACDASLEHLHDNQLPQQLLLPAARRHRMSH